MRHPRRERDGKLRGGALFAGRPQITFALWRVNLICEWPGNKVMHNVLLKIHHTHPVPPPTL
jgi:hypothetical protein